MTRNTGLRQQRWMVTDGNDVIKPIPEAEKLAGAVPLRVLVGV